MTRISIDVLGSARVRREEAYVGAWFPEPLLTDPDQDPERSAELADSVSMAALLLMERLSPLERAVFVLREVFGFGFPEVAPAAPAEPAMSPRVRARGRRRFDHDPGRRGALRPPAAGRAGGADQRATRRTGSSTSSPRVAPVGPDRGRRAARGGRRRGRTRQGR
ncbi:hypothetical protein GCM10010193_06530 [Kitasatospora atroaurantiaca]